MGSYLSLKTRAKSCGSSAGSSLVHSFFNDVLGSASERLKPYLETVFHNIVSGGKAPFPDTRLSTSEFKVAYQAYNLCRKTRLPLWTAPKTEEVMVEEAVKGFLDRELKNLAINHNGHDQEIEAWSSRFPTASPEQLIHVARLKLARLLGYDFPLDEFARSIGFSSGASTRLPRRRGAAPYKFQGKPHVTRGCALLAISLIHYHEPWRLYCQNRFGRESDPFSWLKIVDGSEYFTVPKTATTLRGAAKEPEMNMLCQKGIGELIRRRLRTVGVDLRNQGRNTELAAFGSKDGSLATIDLSSASDSISMRLLELLPPDWAKFIKMTRSERIKLPDGSWHTLQMVSSMGNGFTFELETAIFWSLTSAARDLLCGTDNGYIAVYGDDIICPTVAAPALMNVLSYLGFETNKEKSFYQEDDPFRESCGGHFHYGHDVTPFFLRDSLSSDDDFYLLVNSFNLWAFNTEQSWTEVLSWIEQNKPKRLCFAPEEYGLRSGIIPGSVGYVPGIAFFYKSSKRAAGGQGYLTRLHVTKTKNVGVYEEHGYLAWLMKPGDEILVSREDQRVHRYSKEVLVSRWPDSNVRFPLIVGCTSKTYA